MKIETKLPRPETLRTDAEKLVAWINKHVLSLRIMDDLASDKCFELTTCGILSDFKSFLEPFKLDNCDTWPQNAVKLEHELTAAKKACAEKDEALKAIHQHNSESCEV